jgi:hypothetical protein
MSPKQKMTRDEEHEFYARPENQEPQGPPRRRRSRLTEMVPVRFAPETLEEVRDCADADARSVSAWIRRAVEHELARLGRGNVSNNLSNEPRRTGTDDAGRGGGPLSGGPVNQAGVPFSPWEGGFAPPSVSGHPDR